VTPSENCSNKKPKRLKKRSNGLDAEPFVIREVCFSDYTDLGKAAGNLFLIPFESASMSQKNLLPPAVPPVKVSCD
jgi:hypothetical protein